MSESNHHDRDPEAIETGEPIALLRDREEPASSTFMAALRRRIRRRLLVSDVGRLSWTGPILVAIEIFNMIFSLFGTGRPDEPKER